MNSQTPLISVIVPIYNIAAYLPQCLNSICGQTYPNLEILLIDDGSTDTSLEICKQYAAKDSRIRVFHQENKGVCAARNLGLDKMTGAFFTFVDGDDWVVSHYVQCLFSLIEQYHTPIAVGTLTEQFQTLSQPQSLYVQPIFQKTVNVEEFFTSRLPFNISAKLYRKSFIPHLRFDVRYTLGEDNLFFFEALQQAGTVAVTNRPIYIYQRRNDSATAIPTIQARYLNFKFWQNVKSFIQQQGYRKAQNLVNELALGAAVALSFSILVNEKSPTHYAEFSQESFSFLRENASLLWPCTVMGTAGKLLIYFYIHFPKSVTWLCRLPGVRPFLYTFSAKRLARYKIPANR